MSVGASSLGHPRGWYVCSALVNVCSALHDSHMGTSELKDFYTTEAHKLNHDNDPAGPPPDLLWDELTTGQE